MTPVSSTTKPLNMPTPNFASLYGYLKRLSLATETLQVKLKTRFGGEPVFVYLT
jgi:hypothetical protein